MAPFEKIENPKAQKNSNVQKKLLCDALAEAAGEPKCDERKIVKAYRASWKSQAYWPNIENLFDELGTGKHYPNSAELLRAVIGTTQLSGGITECNKAKHAELAAAWDDSNIKVAQRRPGPLNSWREQLKPGGVLSCPKSLDVPWLFSMDPMSYKENGSEDDEYLHHSDLYLLKPSLHTYFKSGKPGVACFFVYNLGAGGENQQGKFCSFINEIAEHIDVDKRFYSVRHNLRKNKNNIAGLLFSDNELAKEFDPPKIESVSVDNNLGGLKNRILKLNYRPANQMNQRKSRMYTATENRKKDNRRRIARIDNWINHAQSVPDGQEKDSIRFLFFWIAYEAAYKNDDSNLENKDPEHKQRERFHANISKYKYAIVDLQKALGHCQAEAKELLGLRQANQCFWTKLGKCKNWGENATSWERNFVKNSEKSIDNVTAAIYDEKYLEGALNSLFDNLYVVRNQIVHGGSSGEYSLGISQVKWGTKLLKWIVPNIRDCIKRNETEDWGNPPFPRVGEEADEKRRPPWMEGR